MSAEKRKSERMKLEMVGTLARLKPQGEEARSKVMVLDLSFDGARLLTDTHLSVGDRIRLHLDWPKAGGPIELWGEVVRVQDMPSGACEIGVDFKNYLLDEILGAE